MSEHVAEYEKILNKSQRVLQALESPLDQFEANRSDYEALLAYYDSLDYLIRCGRFQPYGQV
ncbi:DUF4298 domain-containing protein [Eremococcus coleocola]|uniref:Uncharacterized protein n=1 Tax=Eremococcus coleocola ACS-139-V-Col8 TaxID=908337 RepID=E4KPU5_9LACT|nr:DUF4298 domain-containing protein [Eremococcus coleocola]EFR31171.1 hypothetical protein HMPREF9257_1584 [Eremococcus coleocola ACS-139-V-Col8]